MPPLQRCVECGPCHTEQLGHLRGAFAMRDEFPRMGDAARVQQIAERKEAVAHDVAGRHDQHEPRPGGSE